MATLSRRQRVLATCVLTAGALASIATSAIRWQLDASAPLPSVTLDQTRLDIGLRVIAELRGPITDPEGDVSVSVAASLPPGEVGTSASLRLSLVDSTGTTVAEQEVVVPAGPPTYLSLWDDVWVDCQPPCVATYNVWVERTESTADGATLAPVVITGSVDVHASKFDDGNEPPAGSALTVIVEEIEVQP